MKEQLEDLAEVQKPLIQIAQERKRNSSAMLRDIPLSLDWLTLLCMDELLETEGGVDHVQGCWITDNCEWTWSTPSQAIRLTEKRDLRIIQHQSASTDPERPLA